MRFTYGLSLVFVVALSSTGWSQILRRGERAAPAAPGTAPAVRREAVENAPQAANADQQIAALLFGCARNEVELSKLAQEKATNEDVRNFAAMMVKDHTPGMEKLQQAAGPLVSAHAPGTPAGAVRREETREEVRREPATERAPGAPAAPRRTKVVEEERTVVEARPAAGQPGQLDWVSIHSQIADQVLATTKSEFQKKEAADFDKCYMGQQIMAHEKTLDELKVLRNYASPELRKDIEETSQMATHHLQEAKKIMDSLKGESTERVSRKPKAP